MKRLRRALKTASVALLIVVAILAAVAFWLIRRPWPQTAGTLAVAGLTAPVEVIRDAWGVPQIYAAGEHDLLFAQGYTHAGDRLWQMEYGRHVSGGTLSSLFGPATLDFDRAMRIFGIRRAALRDWEVLEPGTRAVLTAYAEGVNAYLAGHRGRLPLEFAILGVRPVPWTPIDSLAWAKMVALLLGQNHEIELMRARLIARLGEAAARQLLTPYADSDTLIVSPEAGGYGSLRDARPRPAGALLSALLSAPSLSLGSNNWVVHGSRTASGKPLLANDTHLGLGMPSEWYENGLHGGRFDVVGLSFPGVPLVLLGHNRRIAWGISNMCGDGQDLYLETLNGRGQYRYRGEWRDLQVIHESIAVKGRPPAALDVLATVHGPIINETANLKNAQPMALRWTALEATRLLDAVLHLDMAADWVAFRSALSTWGAPSLNFVYADVDGNIGYQAAGLLPVRAAGDQGMVPVPGESGEHDWRGWIPFAAMPSLANPAAGFLVTANNKVVADNYPYLIAHDYADPYRARRITDLLAAIPKATVADMERIQADTYSAPAAALCPYLAAVHPANRLEEQALGLVRGWDLRFETASAGAAIYYAWYSRLLEDIVGDELGPDLMRDFRPILRAQTPMFLRLMAEPRNRWFDDRRTPRIETRDDIVRRSFTTAVRWLSRRLGGDPAEWTWGRLHTIQFAHQPFGQSGIAPLERLFNSRTFEVPGEVFTVNGESPVLTRPFTVGVGVSQRLIVDLADLSRSLAINSTGQNAQLFHPHREDQIPLWSRNEYRPMLFSRAAVEEGARERLRLMPSGAGREAGSAP
ncbi:MAG TPA: penicillin acylase family protein [Thermoanaerobaculia bacterium]|nr:penicillin acylase family protein [Thermoanaerobaculia bacterium]